MSFIPDTSRQTEMSRQINDIGDISALQRWFLMKASIGNRNNHLIRLAFMLLEDGSSYEDVEDVIMQTNDKLAEPLPVREISQTVMKSARKKLRERDES